MSGPDIWTEISTMILVVHPETNQGFMWLGTQYGLDRYDGYSFQLFVYDPRNPTASAGMGVYALFKDRDGALGGMRSIPE